MSRKVHHLRSLKPPGSHLANVLLEAETLFDGGEVTKGIESLCHAVLVAGTTGFQGMEQHEVIHQLRKIAGWGFPSNSGDEAA